jgi:hypothetical protein
MFRLIRKWFTPSYKDIQKFEYSPEGFQKAKRWAKTQRHPKMPKRHGLTLWDFVKDGWIDSEHKLHQINKIKQNHE